MPTQNELDSTYMGVALLHARLSKARRKAVGACLVTSQGVCIPGYNGTAVGRPNDCEDVDWDGCVRKLVTKRETIHSELNCILKAAREGISCLGATVYVSLSPCVPCSAMLVNAGISRLVYDETYRDKEGLKLLESCGIVVEQFNGSEQHSCKR